MLVGSKRGHAAAALGWPALLARQLTLRSTAYEERPAPQAAPGARRQVLAYVFDEDVVSKLFDEIAPKYADRNGGYTRILKLGPRQGDNAEVVFLELV